MIDTNSEAYRHQCECDSIARMSMEQREDKLERIAKARGLEAANRIRDELRRRENELV